MRSETVPASDVGPGLSAAAGEVGHGSLQMEQLGPVGAAMIERLDIAEDHQHLDIAAGTGEPGLSSQRDCRRRDASVLHTSSRYWRSLAWLVARLRQHLRYEVGQHETRPSATVSRWLKPGSPVPRHVEMLMIFSDVEDARSSAIAPTGPSLLHDDQVPLLPAAESPAHVDAVTSTFSISAPGMRPSRYPMHPPNTKAISWWRTPMPDGSGGMHVVAAGRAYRADAGFILLDTCARRCAVQA